MEKMSREKILEDFINLWNDKKIDELSSFLTPEVELRSTNVLRIFPESKGVLEGRDKILDYFKIVLEKIPNFVIVFEAIKNIDESIVINSRTQDNSLDFHVQYYFDRNNKIYSIKSDLAEKF
jgi:hypothetical protein